MKRITGIAIVIAAFVGCSYVGAAQAESCSKIAESVALVNRAAGDVPASQQAEFAEVMRTMKATLKKSCELGVTAREKGFTAAELSDITVVAYGKANIQDDVTLVGFTSANYATTLGFAFGDK